MFFKDGIRRIDYVLAWETNDDDEKQNAKHKAAREIFEKHLVEEGLELEYDLVCIMAMSYVCLFTKSCYMYLHLRPRKKLSLFLLTFLKRIEEFGRKNFT